MMGHGDNARNRAFLFSTKMNHYREFVRDMCQCPQSGFPHFYDEPGTKAYEIVECQCPQSGFPHFYKGLSYELHHVKNVSMPSIGLSSFLLKFDWTATETINGGCQCPQSGFPHFYVEMVDNDTQDTEVCQCPQSGFPHFYRRAGRLSYEREGVSMPSIGLSSFLPLSQ